MTMSRARTSFTPGTPLPDHWFHILLALADDSRHGLGIIQEVAAQTDGRVQVWPGMLYLALRRPAGARAGLKPIGTCAS